MSDLYLKLANSQLTQPLFQVLNLPQPATLIRSENTSKLELEGNILIAATSNAFAVSGIYKALEHEQVSLFSARSNFSSLNLSAPPSSYKAKSTEIQIDNLENKQFKALVFDATGIKSSEELKQLYNVFTRSVKKISSNGRFVIIGQSPSQIDKSENSAVQGALLGFAKSLSKESGKKGITCNVIYVNKGAQKYIDAPLNFFLSPKAAYITGQSVELTNNSNKQGKVNQDKPLTGKTAIVTGAAQGIGYQTAKTLARDGATVICLDIPVNESATKKLAQEINGHSLALDLNDENAVDTICSTIGAQLGVIDIIVHNAGITRDKTLANMPEHFWDQVININLSKVIDINSALIEKQLLSSNARIICISSISGIAGNFGQSNYASSKAGIASYVKAMSESTAAKQIPGLTINAIAPGFIETDMTQRIPFMTREVGRRMNSLSQGGLPIDIAEGVSFFSRPDANALNGNVLRICGQSLLGK
jgi:3-oxoacyl-[acyl-carrier protein] reductase